MKLYLLLGLFGSFLSLCPFAGKTCNTGKTLGGWACDEEKKIKERSYNTCCKITTHKLLLLLSSIIFHSSMFLSHEGFNHSQTYILALINTDNIAKAPRGTRRYPKGRAGYTRVIPSIHRGVKDESRKLYLGVDRK